MKCPALISPPRDVWPPDQHKKHADHGCHPGDASLGPIRKPYSRLPRLEFPRSVVASLWAPIVATPESRRGPLCTCAEDVVMGGAATGYGYPEPLVRGRERRQSRDMHVAPLTMWGPDADNGRGEADRLVRHGRGCMLGEPAEVVDRRDRQWPPSSPSFVADIGSAILPNPGPGREVAAAGPRSWGAGLTTPARWAKDGQPGRSFLDGLRRTNLGTWADGYNAEKRPNERHVSRPYAPCHAATLVATTLPGCGRSHVALQQCWVTMGGWPVAECLEVVGECDSVPRRKGKQGRSMCKSATNHNTAVGNAVGGDRVYDQLSNRAPHPFRNPAWSPEYVSARAVIRKGHPHPGNSAHRQPLCWQCILPAPPIIPGVGHGEPVTAGHNDDHTQLRTVHLTSPLVTLTAESVM
ncbi:hypothetical protein LA080_006884 [Diaporthe eres]|nr:hypothetical protein LA080_006884 [Diaporthe eres]